MHEATSNPNDTAAALMLGSLLEAALQNYILAILTQPSDRVERELFSSAAPLREFSAKIKIGYAMGLFGPKIRDDLDSIREIRNAFAHSLKPIYFATPEVAKVCERFSVLDQHDLHDNDSENIPRSRFVDTAAILAVLFDAVTHTVKPIQPQNETVEALMRDMA